MTRIRSNDIESAVGEPATATVGLLLVVNGLAKRELPNWARYGYCTWQKHSIC